jgi:hypothetical protein
MTERGWTMKKTLAFKVPNQGLKIPACAGMTFWGKGVLFPFSFWKLFLPKAGKFC